MPQNSLQFWHNSEKYSHQKVHGIFLLKKLHTSTEKFATAQITFEVTQDYQRPLYLINHT